MTLSMRLHAEQVEPALNGALGYARVSSHGSDAPMRSAWRLGLQGGVDDVGDTLVVMRSRSSGTQFVMQSVDAVLKVAAVPSTDGHGIQIQSFGDGGVGLAFGGLDSTSVPVHKHGAGALKKTGRRAIGRSRGGLTTKIHAVSANHRNVLCLGLSPGNSHDAPASRELLKKRRPEVVHLVMDKTCEDATTLQVAAE